MPCCSAKSFVFIACSTPAKAVCGWLTRGGATAAGAAGQDQRAQAAGRKEEDAERLADVAVEE